MSEVRAVGDTAALSDPASVSAITDEGGSRLGRADHAHACAAVRAVDDAGYSAFDDGVFTFDLANDRSAE